MEHNENMDFNPELETPQDGEPVVTPDAAEDNGVPGWAETGEPGGEEITDGPFSPDGDNPDGTESNAEEGGNEDGAENGNGDEKPKRRRKKKEEPKPEDGPEQQDTEPDPPLVEEHPPDLHMEESDGGYADAAGDEGAVAGEPLDPVEEAGPGDVAPEAAPRRRRAAASRRPVVLDASGNAIIDRTDSGQHDLGILTAARNRRRIMTATLDAIDYEGPLPRGVFYIGTVKVLIPFSEMGFDLDPEEVTQREARLLLDSMLGAKIDYMVRGVDAANRVAGASRRDAMLMRQRTILNARLPSGNFRINEGTRCMARVIHVSRLMLRVEVYGFETYLRRDAISNLWVNDISEYVKVGEERPVEIVRLSRDEAGRVTTLRVSMKAAEDHPQMELREGNTYTGHINNFSATAYFVRVAGVPIDIRCPINSNYTTEMMEVGDYVKFYVRGIYDGVPTGAILKIIKKGESAGYGY